MTKPAWAGAFEQFTRGIVERHDIPGVSVCVRVKGQVVYERGFGYRNREEQLEVTPNTIFGVGSITKSFTALAIMRLAEQDHLSVHDPVVQYIPGFQVPHKDYNEHITIHHLLTHTSGLPTLPSRYYAQYRYIMSDPHRDEIPLPYDVTALHAIDTFDDLADLIARFDFDMLGAPGEYVSYSNEGYAFLGAIVERVTGENYAEYVKKNILEPAGLERTAFDPRRVETLGDVTELYSSRQVKGNKLVFATPGWWEKHAMYSCGHLKSTARDLTRYIDLYRLGGRLDKAQVASAESVEAMVQPHEPIVPDPDRYYGYGLVVNPDFHGTRRISHGGGDKGVSAHLDLLPDKDVAVAVLANLSGVPAERIAVGALHAVLGLPVEAAPEYRPQDVSADVLQRYVGLYRSGEGARVRFTLEENQLWVDMGGGQLPATPLGEDRVLVEPSEDQPTVFKFLCEDEESDAWAVAFGLRILTRQG